MYNASELNHHMILLNKIRIIIKKRKKQGMLSHKIDEALRNDNRKTSWLKRLQNFITQLYYPSKKSIFVIIIFAAFLAVLSRLNFLPFDKIPFLKFDTSNQYQNLIAIHAGIGGIIIALLIFVAESFREDTERARVLLKQSFLYPITVFEVLAFLIFVWGNVSLLSIIATFTVALITVFSIYRLIQILLDRPLFIKQRSELLKDRVKLSVNQALKERVGNNIYLETLDSDNYNIDYSFFNEYKKSGFASIRLLKKGVISDINLDKLNILFEKLEECANEQKKSFKGISKSPNASSLTPGTNFSQTQSESYPLTKGYILKKLGDFLNDEDQVALVVPEKFINNPKKEQKIRKLLNDVFNISPQNSIKEDLRIELGNKKDAILEAIHQGKTNALKELSDIYINVVEGFLEIIKEAGAGYSPEAAKKERSSLMGGWDEINWVSKDLYLFLKEAIKTDNNEIISEISRIPILVSIISIRKSDHFVFQEFISFPRYLYFLSFSSIDNETKEYLRDCSWRYLKEISDIYISSEFDDVTKTNEEILNYKDFGISIMQIYLRLMKLAFDKKDLQSFKKFHSTLSSLFEYFEPSRQGYDAQMYRGMLENPKLTENERKKLQTEAERQETLEKVESEINDRKDELFFGLGGWILSKLRTNFDDEQNKQFWDYIKGSLPNDIKKLTDLYLSVSKLDIGNFWGWDTWEMEERPEGVGAFIDIGGKQNWLYCIRGLELIENHNKDELLKIVIATTGQVQFLAGNQESSLNRILLEIEENKENFKKILSEQALNQISLFHDFLTNLISKEKDKEEQDLIAANIDDEKKTKFVEEFLKSFHNSASLRSVFQSIGNYKNYVRKTKKSVDLWGLNQIDDKAAFIKDWHVSYPNWGRSYGEGLSDSEDRRIASEIYQALPELKSKKEDFAELIREGLDALYKKNLKPSIILTDLYVDWYRMDKANINFLQKGQFADTKSKNIINTIGAIKEKSRIIPIMDVRISDNPKNTNYICILDLKKIGRLVQYFPHTDLFENPEIKDNFLIKISDLNQDEKTRERIIKENPEWLKQYTDPVKYLSQKTLITLFEKIELEIKSKHAGLKIIVKKNS
jgi:hypothetical protein